MDNTVTTILMMSLSGSILAAVLFLIRPLIAKHVSKAFLYYIWLPVLLRLLLPFGFGIPLFSASSDAATTTQLAEVLEHGTTDYIVTAVPIDDSDANRLERTPDTGAPTVTEAVPAEAAISGSASMSEKGFDLGNYLLGHLDDLWLAGMFISLGWYILSYAVFYRRLSRSFETPRAADLDLFNAMRRTGNVRLEVSELVETPMLIGILRPTIILPKRAFSENDMERELRDILRHELTHWRRHDLLYKWLAVIVQSVHWFNPVVYFIRRELDKACELSCDEAVVRFMSPNDRVSYGNTLLALAAEHAIPSRITATTLGEGKKEMKARIVSIRDHKKCSAASVVVMLVFAILLTACSTAVASVSEPEDDKPIPNESTEEESPVHIIVENDVLANAVEETEANIAIHEDASVNLSNDGHAVYDEQTTSGAQTNPISATILSVPSEDEVLALREKVEAGMTEEEISQLTETIKVANLWWEQRYMWQDIFNEYQLGDPDSLTWNYFEQTGEIQLGWGYDGTPEEKDAICAEEDLTDYEFYEKYGSLVVAQNDYDADDFIAAMTELKASVRSGLLDEDFDRLIELCSSAKDTHDVACAIEMYHMLHDMDYFLLRYGLSDVGPYLENTGTIAKYYGSLSVWDNEELTS